MGADGRPPAERSLTHHIHSPQIRLLLMPLATRAAPATGTAASAKRPSDHHARGRGSKHARSEPPPAYQGGGKGGACKGGGKGKGKKSLRPPELSGCWNRDASGQFLCWAYNSVAGCTLAAAGATCPKGRHVCMKPGCQQPHPACDHRA